MPKAKIFAIQEYKKVWGIGTLQLTYTHSPNSHVRVVKTATKTYLQIRWIDPVLHWLLFVFVATHYALSSSSTHMDWIQRQH